VVRRNIDAPFLLSEHLEIAPERHSLFVVVKKVRNIRRRRAVCAEKLLFLMFRRHPENKLYLHSHTLRAFPIP
jgi:hypothetical protein